MKLYRIVKNGPSQKIEDEKTVTEKELEDFIWKNPKILGEDYLIFGRQESGEMGRLDLMGIHRSGRLTIFELKRGKADKSAIHQANQYRADVKKYTYSRFESLAKERFVSENEFENTLQKKFKERFNTSLPDFDEAKKKIRLIVIAQELTEQARNAIEDYREEGIDISALLFKWFSKNSCDELILFYPYPPEWTNTDEYALDDKGSQSPDRTGIPIQFKEMIKEKVAQQLQLKWKVKSRNKRYGRNINWNIFSKENRRQRGRLRIRWRRNSNNLQLFWLDKKDNKIPGPMLEKNWRPENVSDKLVQKIVNDAIKFTHSQMRQFL